MSIDPTSIRSRLLLLLIVALVGCGGERSATPEPAPSSAEEVAEDGPQAEAAGPQIALDEEGLRFVDPATGSTRLLAFGMDGEEAVAAVARAIGEPVERFDMEECGVGALEKVDFARGLSLYLDAPDGPFSGWVVAPTGEAGSDALTTMAGIGMGSTRAELEAAYEVHVEETTLGTEFAAGMLFGFLDGEAPDDEVFELFAGSSCYFR